MFGMTDVTQDPTDRFSQKNIRTYIEPRTVEMALVASIHMSA